MGTTRVKNISTNFMCAQQAKQDGASRKELHHLVFAVQDIAEILNTPSASYNDAVIKRQYAESLVHTATRVERLLREELNARTTC